MAHAEVRFAVALDAEFAATRAALAAGSVLVEQARVIMAAVRDLPDGIDVETRTVREWRRWAGLLTHHSLSRRLDRPSTLTSIES